MHLNPKQAYLWIGTRLPPVAETPRKTSHPTIPSEGITDSQSLKTGVPPKRVDIITTQQEHLWKKQF